MLISFYYTALFFTFFCIVYCQPHGTCHAIGLKGAFDSADIVISGNLTAQDDDRLVYTFFILKVLKGSKERLDWTNAALINKTIEARPVNIHSGCAKSWRYRQPTEGLMSEYVMFLRNNLNFWVFSPADESGEYRSRNGQISHYWDECRYRELETNQWGLCTACVTEEGVVIENGDRVSLEDGCNSCTCADGGALVCTDQLCSHHIAGIAVSVLLAVGVILSCVGVAVRRYRAARKPTYVVGVLDGGAASEEDGNYASHLLTRRVNESGEFVSTRE